MFQMLRKDIVARNGKKTVFYIDVWKENSILHRCTVTTLHSGAEQLRIKT